MGSSVMVVLFTCITQWLMLYIFSQVFVYIHLCAYIGLYILVIDMYVYLYMYIYVVYSRYRQALPA